MVQESLYFNGLDGDTGAYLFPPLDTEGFIGRLRERPRGSVAKDSGIRGPRRRIDPCDFASSGWGVVFAQGAGEGVREGLRPLLRLRQAQASAEDPRLYREFRGEDGVAPGESALDFLARHRVGLGHTPDPSRVPFFLLLVGGPEEIPYDFQFLLDAQYGVGRLSFETVEEYASYARTVVAVETGEITRDRRTVLFGVANKGDPATHLSTSELMEPLAGALRTEPDGWQIETLLKEEATRSRLRATLGGTGTPALFFSASHGLGFACGSEAQRPYQGALVCQDWEGPSSDHGLALREHVFAAEDVEDGAPPQGLIAFHFACYGAGTPERDSFHHLVPGQPARLADNPFVAALPQRLLGHPRGGALAVVGHVDRAWSCSFRWRSKEPQIDSFQALFTALMRGDPLGAAMAPFNERWTILATYLGHELAKLARGEEVDNRNLLDLWTATNDVRSYIILGDPAVRVAVRRTKP